MDTRPNTTEIAIVACAVALLENWSWTKHGEPIGALSTASRLLFGTELPDEIVNIKKAELVYVAGNAPWNNVEARLASLRAVLKFCR